jgi:hypothetical protein
MFGPLMSQTLLPLYGSLSKDKESQTLLLNAAPATGNFRA